MRTCAKYTERRSQTRPALARGARRRGECADSIAIDLVAPTSVALQVAACDHRIGAGEQTIDRRYAEIRLAPGIAAQDVTVSRDGVDLIVTGAGTTGRVQGWYNDPQAMPATSLVFANGTRVEAASLTDIGLHLHGTTGDDTLVGLALFVLVLFWD